jgi:glucose-1-phosphate thymidylyltransferase
MGDGSQWGLQITYAVQDQPKGIADGIKIALSTFEKPESVLVVLGDNVFHGQGLGRYIAEIADSAECVIWTQEVNNPESFGIATLSANGKIESIIEKPKHGNGNLAITGLYHFPSSIHKEINGLTISNRGEFEITEILNRYLVADQIIHEKLSRGVYWLDAGTTDNLLDASQYVHSVQSRQGYLIGSPDEAAWRMNRINKNHFEELVSAMPESSYRDSLSNLLI